MGTLRIALYALDVADHRQMNRQRGSEEPPYITIPLTIIVPERPLMRPLNLARDMGAGAPHHSEQHRRAEFQDRKQFTVDKVIVLHTTSRIQRFWGGWWNVGGVLRVQKDGASPAPLGAPSGRTFMRCTARALSRFCTDLLGFLLRLDRLRGSRVKKWPIICKYREKRAYT